MKKLIALMLMFALFATSVFAVPYSGSFTFDLNATELTESETLEVEGNGPIFSLVGQLCLGIQFASMAASQAVKSEAMARPLKNAAVLFGTIAIVSQFLPW